MECPICYEIKNSFSLPWSCGHSFCNICTENLISNDHNCPVCRDSTLIHYQINNESNNLKTNVLDINYIEKNIKKVHNEQSYISKWKKKQCINDNHNLIIRQTYGVIIICKDCNLIDSFNLIY